MATMSVVTGMDIRPAAALSGLPQKPARRSSTRGRTTATDRVSQHGGPRLDHIRNGPGSRVTAPAPRTASTPLAGCDAGRRDARPRRRSRHRDGCLAGALHGTEPRRHDPARRHHRRRAAVPTAASRARPRRRVRRRCRTPRRVRCRQHHDHRDQRLVDLARDGRRLDAHDHRHRRDDDHQGRRGDRPVRSPGRRQDPLPADRRRRRELHGHGDRRRLPSVLGQATAVDGDSITLSQPDGSSVTVHVDSSTKFTVGGETGKSVADVEVGMIVAASGEENADGSLNASRVRAGTIWDGPGRGLGAATDRGVAHPRRRGPVRVARELLEQRELIPPITEHSRRRDLLPSTSCALGSAPTPGPSRGPGVSVSDLPAQVLPNIHRPTESPNLDAPNPRVIGQVLPTAWFWPPSRPSKGQSRAEFLTFNHRG